MSHPVLEAAQVGLNTNLAHAGDLTILDQPRRALLISRTQRHPAPDTPWVSATVAATRKLAAQDEALVTGVDRLPFDLALWNSRQLSNAAIIALTQAPTSDTDWRALLPDRHLLIWPTQSAKEKEALQRRDWLLALLADRAYAIHVRVAGHMAEVALQLKQRHCLVETWPMSVARTSAVALPCSSPTPLLTPWTYLIHFTREPDGAFVGEPYTNYLQWLSSGAPYTPRDGLATLHRILSEKRLRGCGRMISDAIPMVCFTAMPLPQALTLRRWRRGLSRWSFSNYGLAIQQQTLVRLGAQPVRYVSRRVMDDTPLVERAYLQVEASKMLDWKVEAEWRVGDDVDLSLISVNDLLAIVATQSEADVLQREFGIKTIMASCLTARANRRVARF
ncbi:MAG: hypothetical protein V1899_11115 [Planctomycetota bacterium]